MPPSFSADEQTIADVLVSFWRHIERLLDGLSDSRVGEVQTQCPAPGSQQPEPADPLHPILDFLARLKRAGFDQPILQPRFIPQCLPDLEGGDGRTNGVLDLL